MYNSFQPPPPHTHTHRVLVVQLLHNGSQDSEALVEEVISVADVVTQVSQDGWQHQHTRF